MKKLLYLKIKNKKLLNLLEKCNILGISFCLFSFLFTYYYFQLYISNILNISILLLQTGLSIIIGALISCFIIQEHLAD
ncbi:MAG: hypothetical protein J6J60_05385 [Clostridia bacterium]|nr:hypothetical protein [Clostridia bacterium]